MIATDTDTYRIVRMFFNDPRANKVIETGLTLDEAQAHCRDPETSSRTCVLPVNVRRTTLNGPWFDGYEKED